MLAKVLTEKKYNGISTGKPSENKQTSFFKKLETDGSASSHGRRLRTNKQAKSNTLPAFTPWKVILVSFLIGICGILYIGHVFKTQQVLEEVNQLELEYNRTLRHYHDQRLIYDRQTGPREIYRHAREHGFINAGPANQILIIDSE